VKIPWRRCDDGEAEVRFLSEIEGIVLVFIEGSQNKS
jgi:hypothetical protein